MLIDKDLILRLDKPGPRYTSYPTAPEWKTHVTTEAYARQLAVLNDDDSSLSVYVHIPFCESLCYFCGCQMNVRRPGSKVGDVYIDAVTRELGMIRRSLTRRKTVRQIHWGGGTPSFLTETQFERLFALLVDNFCIDPKAEIAIEVDPRRVTRSKIMTLRRLGFNRISIGVQDFDQRVQEEINRRQPFGLVDAFTRWCREAEFPSVNFDLVYGLPWQTVESFQRTVSLTRQLRPDRIALYSFAFLPWLKKHHRKLNATALPDRETKLGIFLQARRELQEGGYAAIAMDHFALPTDDLYKAFARGTLYRNFMGYTLRPADEFLGLGVSAISHFSSGYFQNVKTLPEYYQAIDDGQLPVSRGKWLNEDDQRRQWVIRALMCQFAVDKRAFGERFQVPFETVFADEQDDIRSCEADGLVVDTAASLQLTDRGQLFVRNVCMVFDWYLRQQQAHTRFSQTV